MMYYDQFNTGKRIQKLRRERYLTQEELADRCELTKGYISATATSAVLRVGSIFLLLTFSSKSLHFLM